MDLTEAEALGDLVAAETEAQRRQARVSSMARWAPSWRLGRPAPPVAGAAEALIDFPDEDLPPEVEAEIVTELAALHQAVASR